MTRKQLNRFLNSLIFTGLVVMVGLPLALVIPGVPEIWYRVDASAVDKELDYLTRDLGTTPQEIQDNKTFVARAKPPLDPSLTKESRVLIPSINVNGPIYEGPDAKNLLTKGIWRTNNFGNPEDTTLPMILASHRYGNPNWSKDFRDKEIFFHLDQVREGEEIEVIWNQRIYRYRVYKTDVGHLPTDIGFDLLLYTCNFWNSPDRIYVYARRVN